MYMSTLLTLKPAIHVDYVLISKMPVILLRHFLPNSTMLPDLNLNLIWRVYIPLIIPLDPTPILWTCCEYLFQIEGHSRIYSWKEKHCTNTWKIYISLIKSLAEWHRLIKPIRKSKGNPAMIFRAYLVL